MDFRQYDNALGRFNGIDLLAENSMEMTPYHFGNNSPVYFSDPSGLFSNWDDAINYALNHGGGEVRNIDGVYTVIYHEDGGASNVWTSQIDGMFNYTIVGRVGGGGTSSGSSSSAGVSSDFASDWAAFNSNIVTPVSGVAGIFGEGASYGGTSISTAQAFSKKALSETLANARVLKITGAVSYVGNISQSGLAVWNYSQNRTNSNLARIVAQGTIIGLEIGLNGVVPGLGLVVGFGLSAFESSDIMQSWYSSLDK